jgi:uncharacterized membrane protein
MEGIAEGLTFIFIGMLVLFVTILAGTENSASLIVDRISAVMLTIMAVLSFFTGAKVAIIPMKICPIVKRALLLCFFWEVSLSFRNVLHPLSSIFPVSLNE